MRGNRFANHASAIHVSIGSVGKIERKRERQLVGIWYTLNPTQLTAPVELPLCSAARV